MAKWLLGDGNTRAVGAVVISPALQRWVGTTNNSFGVPYGTALILGAIIQSLYKERRIS